MPRPCLSHAGRTPIPPNSAPLIVTAVPDAAAFAILDGLRQRHFPAGLNKVPAHISLFHQLPGDAEMQIVRHVGRTTNGRVAPVVRAKGLKFLGRGVAIDYDGGALDAARADLAKEWSDWLTPQDRQKFRAHVTIQNKVSSDQARALFDSLQGVALPDCRIEAHAIWRYLGGPWEPIAEFRFADGSH